MVLALAGFALISFGIVLITTSAAGARSGLTVNEVAIAVGVGLLVVAAAEGIRAWLGRSRASRRLDEAATRN